MANTVKEELGVVILGDGGVGKSCITIRYTQKRFQATYDPTIEDVYRKEITLDDKEYPPKKYPKLAGTYVLEIFDTAGQVWKYFY